MWMLRVVTPKREARPPYMVGARSFQVLQETPCYFGSATLISPFSISTG
jgi:hypothetical protein